MPLISRYTFLILVLLPAIASALHGKKESACDALSNLPEECTCTDKGTFGLTIICMKKFEGDYFNDSIGMEIDVDPCNKLGSRISLRVIDQEKGIDYSIAGIRAGEEKNFPIPGFSIIVPHLGSVGMFTTVIILGNPDMLTLKVGLNACTEVARHELCASKFPVVDEVLPWYVLEGTYSFGHHCSNNATATEGR